MSRPRTDPLEETFAAKAATDSAWALAYATLQAAQALNRIAHELDKLGLNTAGVCGQAPGGMEGIAMAIAGRLPAETC